ncbi:MAG: HAMP domain-containing histidine kinase [Rhodospirillaceae bacterium]|jgi:two-component system, cell cycle sensor histidine kinase PleC|nr:HAMP domain-containing histidine kinase [Rhodospirillaceae bacterium]MBT4589099.1 HAMP domain-containing histidine kinase [Rhodospirillaceae bacterium]MBT4938533.1 HAMP domain-containing histidine kinase [Rhodospirillaceae bacterium]MBT5940810.1 HAMP domain-containing histidine kinase [Rhodospirillaceae bacterium]MBT7267252.1 HAMP domain-containing histidine kinase [Rhodospirillaceae bacterium]
MNSNDEENEREMRDVEATLVKALQDHAGLKDDVMAKVKQFAHDIKNPLTAMIGLSKLMKSGMTTADKIQPNAEIIHQSSVRILDLCEDMLLHTEAALNENRATPKAIDNDKVQDVDAVEIIEEVAALYAEMARERDINLRVEISENFPKIHTVPAHLYRALTNIMSNAMKFTPAGGEVAIKAEIDDLDDAVILVVRDTGGGIPATQIPHILQPYKTTVSPHGDKGTGLGLPIVNQLMMALGGKMEIHSQEHEGTTVTLRFPKKMTRE